MILSLLALAACSGRDTAMHIDTGPVSGSWTPMPTLPEPVSNNAVAAVATDDGCEIVTAFGIDASRAATGIHRRAWAITTGDDAWRDIGPVPGTDGLLATSAVGLRGEFYVLGGYSVAPGGGEVSTDEMWRRPPGGDWSAAAPLPIPIDDAAVAVWSDRWIVVVSGWSTTGSVAAVQIYDAELQTWAQANDFPGDPVFGHAGAISGDDLIVIDGVATQGFNFNTVAQTWHGALNPDDPTTIVWTQLDDHPGDMRYRAAPGTRPNGEIAFHGGTETSYNYDGLAYSGGDAAEPLGSTLVWSPQTMAWREEGGISTMDHRSMAACGESLWVVGGMVEGPEVTAEVWTLVQ